MKKILYFCCLMGWMLALPACSEDDEEETVVYPGAEKITYGTVSDKAGNVYKTLTIGKQTWLAENFRYRLAEGTPADQLTYGESYKNSDRAILEGNDMAAYQNFCKTSSGEEFLYYLREQLFVAEEAGRLNSASGFGGDWVRSQVIRYTIPELLALAGGRLDDIKDELLRIWEDAVDHLFKVDQDYLERFGYLYSYEGALRAVKEGAPEGFHLPTDAEWMMLERQLGMSTEELEGLENWRGRVGELLKKGEHGIGFDALYAGAAVYTLSSQFTSYYVNKGEDAYFWSSDRVFVSDSLSNGIVRNISQNHAGIRRMTSRLIASPENIRPSYSVRLVKTEEN